MTATDPGVGLELARAQPLLPMAPDEARQVMEAYQSTCKAILTRDDVQRVGDREFTTRSGFQKLAAAYGVSTEIVRVHVTHEKDEEDGQDVMIARAVVRAIHPSGRHAEGDGACSSREKRFTKGDEKMDHSLPATAVTRATNRAGSNLIAFGTVSAEEAESTLGEGGPASPPSVPSWAAPMQDIPGVAHNIRRILEAAGHDNANARAMEIGEQMFQLCDGSFPFALARFAHLLAGAVEPASYDSVTGTDPDHIEPDLETVSGEPVDDSNEQGEEDAS